MARHPHHLVVLSSGAASRLRPWSDTHTKTLLPTCDGPLLARLVNALGHDAESVSVVSQVPPASSSAMLRRAIADIAPGASLHVVGAQGRDPWIEVYALLRSLGATASVVLVNGDLVLDPAWAKIAQDAVTTGRTTLCAQHPDGHGHRFGVTRTGRQAYAYTSYAAEVDVEAIGLSVLAPAVLAEVDPNRAVGANPWFDVVLPRLADAGPVDVAVRDHVWADLGSWPALLRWEAARHSGEPGRGCRAGEVGAGTALLGSVVMAGGRVGAGCRLEDVVVLPGGVVDDGVSLRREVVGPEWSLSLLA